MDCKRPPWQLIPQNSYYCHRPVPLEILGSGSFQISTKIKLFAGSWWRSTVGRTLVSADKLSLSCARLLAGRVTTLWLRYQSANMANSAIHPSGVGK